jgi:hypothetical protein
MGSYLIEFHKDGLRRAVSSHAGPFEETMRAAHEGMAQHQADVVRVIDTDSLAEVLYFERDSSDL